MIGLHGFSSKYHDGLWRTMVEHSDIVELDQGLLKAWPIFNVLNSLRFGWLVYGGFLKCEIPPKPMGFNTISWSPMTWMIWGYPHDSGNLHIVYPHCVPQKSTHRLSKGQPSIEILSGMGGKFIQLQNKTAKCLAKCWKNSTVSIYVPKEKAKDSATWG